MKCDGLYITLATLMRKKYKKEKGFICVTYRKTVDALITIVFFISYKIVSKII